MRSGVRSEASATGPSAFTAVCSGFAAVRSQVLVPVSCQAPATSFAASASIRRVGWPSWSKPRKVTPNSSVPSRFDRAAWITVCPSPDPCRSQSPVSATDSTDRPPWVSSDRLSS